ncbi:MAG: hypothetical protein GVY35_05075 [Bacteroidetes bacterium]|nr:hypothetical protein [Bacteroidota bacterium]
MGGRYLHEASGGYVKYVKAKVVVRRIAPPESETDDEFLILATWTVDPARATTFYEERWEIETMFGALKSRGYRLEKTHLTALTQKFLQQVEDSLAWWRWPSLGRTSLENGEQPGRAHPV